MEKRIICHHCDNDEFHVLHLGENEFVQFKCLECGTIIKSYSDDDPLKKFTIASFPVFENN